MIKPTYCTQNQGDCDTCSLVNYGTDCFGVEIYPKEQSVLVSVAYGKNAIERKANQFDLEFSLYGLNCENTNEEVGSVFFGTEAQAIAFFKKQCEQLNIENDSNVCELKGVDHIPHDYLKISGNPHEAIVEIPTVLNDYVSYDSNSGLVEICGYEPIYKLI